MAVNTNFQIPFIPAEGITAQILTAIQTANEQHYRNQQLQMEQQRNQIAQQQANTASQKAPSEIQEAAERAGLFGEEARQKRQQTDIQQQNQLKFNDVVQPSDQTATPSGVWLPDRTPKSEAQAVSGMLQGLNPTGAERNILQASSDAGAAKATNLGGNRFDYLEELKNGIEKVTANRNAVAKIPGEQQISQRDADSINQGLVMQFKGQFPNQPVPDSMLVKAGDTKDHVNNIKQIYENLEQRAQARSQNAITAGIAQQGADIRSMLAGMQAEKFGSEPVIAYDKQNKELIQTTRGDVQRSGGALTNPSTTLTDSQAQKHRDTLGQLNEAQLNLSRAEQAYKSFGELSLSDKRAVAAIEGDDKFHAEFGFGKQGVQLPVDWYNRLLNNENFKALSPQAKAAVIGDIRMQGPMVLAYTKALTNTGRMNEVALRAEGRTVPNAGMDPATRDQLILSFQQNIDQLAKSTPRMVGMDKPSDVRQQIESEPMPSFPPPPDQTLGHQFPNARYFFRSLLGVQPKGQP